jgi:hypothetical protein
MPDQHPAAIGIITGVVVLVADEKEATSSRDDEKGSSTEI